MLVNEQKTKILFSGEILVRPCHQLLLYCSSITINDFVDCCNLNISLTPLHLNWSTAIVAVVVVAVVVVGGGSVIVV